MRKLLLAALAAGLLFAPVSWVSAQEPQAILDKAVKAHGGKEKLASIKAVQSKTKGKLEVMGNSIEFTGESAAQLPDKLKEVLHLDFNGMKINQIVVYDGKQGWISTNGMTMDMPESILETIKDTIAVGSVARLAFVGEKGYEATALGETKVNDRPAVGVKISKKGQKEVNLYFDKETGLLAKTEHRGKDPMNGQEVNEERIITEYQDLNGMKTPKKMLVMKDGKKFLEAEIIDMKYPDKLDDSEFAKP
jgi:outer membrane lipoprotein-sorting protein